MIINLFNEWREVAAWSLLIVIFVYFLIRRNKYSKKHKINVKIADKLIKRVNQLPNDGAKISYLRKIDPYVFEELVLTCFSKNGFKIKRNTKYSGDGGIDGKVFKEKDCFLIQSKRYKGNINPEHVKEFCDVIMKEHAHGGYFVHTGKTGNLSKTYAKQFQNIQFISGSKLLDLINIEKNENRA